jgi:hypothetical protein
VSPPAGRPDDLIDEIEMVDEQPLIIHAGCRKLGRLSVKTRRETFLVYLPLWTSVRIFRTVAVYEDK